MPTFSQNWQELRYSKPLWLIIKFMDTCGFKNKISGLLVEFVSFEKKELFHEEETDSRTLNDLWLNNLRKLIYSGINYWIIHDIM